MREIIRHGRANDVQVRFVETLHLAHILCFDERIDVRIFHIARCIVG